MKKIILFMILALSGCATTSAKTEQVSKEPAYCEYFAKTNSSESAKEGLGPKLYKLIEGDFELTYCSPVINKVNGYIIYSVTLRDRKMEAPFLRMDSILEFELVNGQWVNGANRPIYISTDEDNLSPEVKTLMRPEGVTL